MSTNLVVLPTALAPHVFLSPGLQFCLPLLSFAFPSRYSACRRVSNTTFRVSGIVHHVFLAFDLWIMLGKFDYPYFIDKESGAQRG